MTSGSSPRTGGCRRVLIALLAACAFIAAAAPSAQGASAYFCPTTGSLTLGAGNGCTGGSANWITQVSYFQPSAANEHCAVGKYDRDPDSAVLITAVCGRGAIGTGEIATIASISPWAYPRGRNSSGSTGTGFYGIYYW